MLDGLKKAHNYIFVDGPNLSPFIPKEPELLAFLDKRQKRKIKSESVKNQENLRFQTYTKEKEKISEIVFAVESVSSRRARGKGTFTDPNTKKIFNSIMKFWADEISLDVMYFKGKPVCYMFGILNAKTFYALNTAYLEGYQDIIPGKMVVYYLLQRLQASGVELFDFLRGSSRFKQDFTPFFSEQYDVYFSNNILVRIWWALGVNFTNFIKESGLLYKIYLTFKNQALTFLGINPKLAHT
jgi:CelD/BcsL family acetyltransferase involved in cellulose biosynthesis